MSDETKDVKEEVVEAPVDEAPKATAKKKADKAVAPSPEAPVDEPVVDVEAIQASVSETSVDGKLGFTPNATITAISSNSTTFTFTVANSFTAGQPVLVQGCVPTAYNGTWTVATASSSQFTVTNSTNPGSGTTFGTAVAATNAPQTLNTATAYNMWSPWIPVQNGDPIGYNQSVNVKDWAGALVFQNGQYNTTQRGF